MRKKPKPPARTWMDEWNRGQKMVNGAVLVSLFLYPLAGMFKAMAQYVEPNDAGSFIGFIAWTLWAWFMSYRLFMKILCAGVDKQDEKG
jgi:hypothetical protein